jgi:hypothetical protein
MLHGWLGYRTEADPTLLADYVAALLKNDKSKKELQKLCIDQLYDFLGEGKCLQLENSYYVVWFSADLASSPNMLCSIVAVCVPFPSSCSLLFVCCLSILDYSNGNFCLIALNSLFTHDAENEYDLRVYPTVCRNKAICL